MVIRAGHGARATSPLPGSYVTTVKTPLEAEAKAKLPNAQTQNNKPLPLGSMNSSSTPTVTSERATGACARYCRGMLPFFSRFIIMLLLATATGLAGVSWSGNFRVLERGAHLRSVVLNSLCVCVCAVCSCSARAQDGGGHACGQQRPQKPLRTAKFSRTKIKRFRIGLLYEELFPSQMLTALKIRYARAAPAHHPAWGSELGLLYQHAR